MLDTFCDQQSTPSYIPCTLCSAKLPQWHFTPVVFKWWVHHLNTADIKFHNLFTMAIKCSCHFAISTLPLDHFIVHELLTTPRQSEVLHYQGCVSHILHSNVRGHISTSPALFVVQSTLLIRTRCTDEMSQNWLKHLCVPKNTYNKHIQNKYLNFGAAWEE